MRIITITLRIITITLIIYSILIFITLLFINCTRSNQKGRTDYDQLYALWHEDIFKDSIAMELKPYVNTALTLNNTKQAREQVDDLLLKLRWTRDSISFFKLSKKAILFSERASDDNLLASTYNNIGMYYHDIGVLDSTFYYYVKAENVYKSVGDSMKVGEMEFFQARVLYEKGLRMESEVKVANSLKILQNYQLNPVPFEANQLMALCLIERGEYNKGKEYLLKAIDLMLSDLGKNKVLDSKYLFYAIAMGYNNLSALEIVLENYQKASINAQEGLKYLPKNSSRILSGILNSNKARAEFYNSLTKDRDKAEYYISIVKQTYEIAKQLKHSYLQYNSAIMIADMYYELEKHKQALDWAKRAYLLATEKEFKVFKKEALEFILMLEGFENKKQIAEVLQLNNILVKEDNTTRNRFARIEYETQEIILENDQLKRTLFLLSLGGSLILVFSCLIFYVVRLKMKNKEIKLISRQQADNEQIFQLVLEKSEVINSTQNRIAKDLHDGVINNIFTIRFNLQAIKTEEVKLKNSLIKELQELENNTRNITHVLYKENFIQNNTLISLVEDLIVNQKNEWGTLFSFEKEKGINKEKLTPLDKVNIYFVIREAVQNVNKHSKATKCSIVFKSEQGGFSVRIVDNGAGFDQNLKPYGIGINSMKERLSSLKSELIINSSINSGTEIFFKIEC